METVKLAFEAGAAAGAFVVGLLLVVALGLLVLGFLWELRP